MSAPKVVSVVLTWNQKAVSIRCIESVLASRYEAADLVVVDNGSTDGLTDELRNRFGEHHLVFNEKNLGYVGGNNRGIEEAIRQQADYIFLLNNDVVIEPDAIERLVACAEARPALGLLGPVVYNTVTGQPDNYGWSFYPPKGELTKVREKPAGTHGLVPTDVVPGCSFFIRASAISTVGLLDERMFIFWEDTDYSLRFKKHGFDVGIVADSVVWHENALSVPKNSPPRVYYNFRNHLLLMQKHGGWKDWATFLPYFARNDLVDLLADGLRTGRSAPGAALKRVTAGLCGVLHFLLRRWGQAPRWLS